MIFLNTEINDNNKINEKISEKKFENNSNIDTKNVEDLINKYSSYSEKELMQELIKLSNEKKQNGTLNQDLNNFSNVLSPYLNEEQKSKMNDLFNKIK